MYAQRSFLFGADTGPSLFVKLKAGTDHTVIPCVANDRAYGVSYEGTRQAPIPDVTPLAAKTGESAGVYGPGEPCEIIAGATIAAGDYLKPDANARAIPTATGNAYSAIAVSGAAAGEKVKVTIQAGISP